MKFQNLKWLRILLFLPLVLLLVITNVYIDPANIFHNYSKDIADSILAGNSAYFGSGNFDERGVKQNMIKSMPDKVGCIAVGPSLAMGIRYSDVGTESFYNLSASKLNFYDYLNIFGFMKANNKKADRIILCVDSYFFDESKYNGGSSFSFGNKYAEYMEAVLNRKNPGLPEESNDSKFKEFSQAFSITYFQSSVKYIQSQDSYILKQKRWGILDENTENLAHYMSDGSWVYSLDYRNRTAENMIDDVNKYNIDEIFSKGKHASRHSMDIFEKLVLYFTEMGTEVNLYLCPLPPSLWERIKSGDSLGEYYILDELEIFANEIAKKYNLKITGSYNPYNLNVKDEDFYDARHLRHEQLSKFFDFTSKTSSKKEQQHKSNI